MARETFISYKYTDAAHTRDKIIEKLGADARYYRGENGTSPNLADRKTETIKAILRDMIFQTSVTIVVCSPNMTQSSWIGWEISNSLRETSRNGATSRRNGVVGVVQESEGGYEWLRTSRVRADGHRTVSTRGVLLQDVITANRFNQTPQVYQCEACENVDPLLGSYVSLVNEVDFLADPNKYIENAYAKSQRPHDYRIRVDV